MPVYKDEERNTWFIKFVYHDAFGKKRYITKRGFSTKKIAKEQERILILEKEEVGKKSINFGDLFSMYLNYKKDRVKPRTIYNYQMLYNKQLAPSFENMFVHKITIPMIEEFQQNLLKENLSNAYMEKVQTLFKTTLRFGVRKLIIDNNPFDYIDPVKNHNEVKKEMLFFTPEDFEKFISVVSDPLHSLIFESLYWTGMRVSELQARTWKDLNFNTGDLRIHSNFDNKNKKITNSTKNGETRIIYIPETLLKKIKDRYNDMSAIDGFSDTFYIWGINTPTPHKTIENAKNRYVDKYNNEHDEQIPKIRIHDFRHSHVSYLANHGADSWDIAERLGHSKDMVEKRYSHMFPEKRKKMQKLLD